MNRRQFFILLAVLAALIAAGVAVMWLQRADWRGSGGKVGERLIPGLVLSEIAKIRIIGDGETVSLGRVDGKWQVVERNGYPANVDRIAELLAKLAELKITQLETLVDSQRARLELLDPKAGKGKDTGTVVELGPAVDGFEIGDPIVGTFIMPCDGCPACLRGRGDLCAKFFAMNRLRGTLYDGETRLYRRGGDPLAMYSMGGLAEYAVLPASAAFAAPARVSLEAAGVLGCAAFTAFGAVRHAADLRAGARVAVVATGGVGSLIVHFARAFGALQVIAVDIGAEKLEAARSLGATHTVDASSGDAAAQVLELTGGAGVDIAFEALGRPDTFLEAVAMLADGGKMVAVGIAPIDVRAPIDITRLVRRGLHIVGSYGARPRTDMPALLALIEQGVIDPVRAVTRRFPLGEVDAAYGALDRGEIVGRAIVTMGA